MKRKEFLLILDQKLVSLPVSERTEIMSDFNEHFDTAMADGKSEEEACAELGSPYEIAKQYVGEVETEAPAAKKNSGYIAVVFIGLLLLDFIIVIPIIATILSVIISLWVTLLVLAIVAVLLILGALISFIPTIGFTAIVSLGVCFGGVALAAITALLSIGLFYLSKWFFKGCGAYIKLHANVLKGEF